jgi:DNA-binding PadR family transcriptional regulator
VKLTEIRYALLKRFTRGAKTLQDLTNDNRGGSSGPMAPEVIRQYIEDLEAAGCLKRNRDGRYRLTPEGMESVEAHNRAPVVVPVRNSTSKETYKPGAWLVRDGANAHLACKSRGNSV